MDLIELLRELVRTPSVLGNEGSVASLIGRCLEQKGFDQVHADAAGNVLGVIGSQNAGPTVLFDAHMDTVDVVPVESWSFEPFGAQVAGDRIYGRGATDMKGALAAMVYALGDLRRSSLRGRAVLCASVGEESTEGSALRLAMDRVAPDFVVIGEPTGLRLARAGRGRAEFVVRTAGRPAHASSPHLGVNAVHGMWPLIREIEAIPLPSHPFVGTGALCLTDIISIPYPAQSCVPSGCRATYERRLVPGDTLEKCLSDFGSACERSGTEGAKIELAQADYATYTGMHFRQPKWYPAWVLAQDEPLVSKAQRALSAAGLPGDCAAYQFCTNAAYSAGIAGVPTIGFGPSAETLAHMVDEYIEVEQLLRARQGYREIALSLLS